ncbi:hypothetical protein [Actinacidiphila oryziradicis]|uniref:Uncharacterized protein n=1 Tax=Actinacidiphila oryziradicis TaxID=2571141 RepID=A0A4U0RLD9_9ACTN|nr:hypothetical protein [Actinacidiphila oryziradicis]TJZ95852.1 hypothetical protein FCI23_51745 [Actinacidiphila oryziradicis]
MSAGSRPRRLPCAAAGEGPEPVQLGEAHGVVEPVGDGAVVLGVAGRGAVVDVGDHLAGALGGQAREALPAHRGRVRGGGFLSRCRS